jgi:membrane protein implicated in regulation of membrane protease activity
VDPVHTGVFTLTQRQKRLRVFTGILLITVLAMVAAGMLHPFFHPARMGVLEGAARKALRAQLLLIAAWWSAVLIGAFLTAVLAWLDYKEVRRQALKAQVHVLRSMRKSRTETGEK